MTDHRDSLWPLSGHWTLALGVLTYLGALYALWRAVR